MNTNVKSIYAIMAKNAAGRQQIANDFHACLPQTFPAQSSHWWHDADLGVAIYAALALPETHGSIAGTGHLLATESTTIGGDLSDHLVSRGVLQQIQAQGIQAIDGLDGQFSLVVWDGVRNELLLARDHLGQSAIYLRESADHWIICSELAPLLDDPAFECQLDLPSAFHYLAFGVPLNGQTLAKQVRKLRAGHYFSLSPSRPLFEHRYFTPLTGDAIKVATPALRQEIKASLDQAISRRASQQRDEKPSAILLSSGIDSSYITKTLHDQNMHQGLEAFTIEFAPPCQNNESDQASEFAQQLDIPHQRVFFDYPEVVKALGNITNAAEPCSAFACVTHDYLLGQIKAAGHDFLISGLGSDEIFGGYHKYLKFYSSMRLHQSEHYGIDSFEQLLWQPELVNEKVFAGVPRFFNAQSIKRDLKAPFNQWDFAAQLSEFYRDCRRLKPNAHLFELMIAHECQHRIPELLLNGFEGIGRTTGIQTVYPFLDKKLVQMVIGLGAAERFEMRDNQWDNKIMMRQIATSRLPDAICARPRQAYVPPLLVWLAHEPFFEQIWSLIEHSKLQDAGLFDPALLPEMKSKVRQIIKTNDIRASLAEVDEMWVIYTLSAWYDRWVSQ